MVASFANWPWENLGSYKYVMYGPFVAQVANLWWHGDKITTSFGFHILLLSMLRGLVHQLWTLLGNMHFISFDRRVVSQGVDFEQIDREWDWDNFLILHAYGAGIACYAFPFLSSGLPEWDIVGLIIALGFHVAASEPLFYLIHRYLLHGKMYQNYHSLHHSSPVPQPFTAGHGTMAEQMMIIPIIGIPIMGAGLMGHASMSLIYGYILIFDFLRCFGHSNIEFIPHRLFDSLPFLKFLVYTPTYHSLHHTEQNTNFCLFMPLYDAFGNTLNPKSWSLHKQLSLNAGANKGRAADFVFLVHVVDLSSALHVPWMFRSFASMPYTFRWFILPCLPGTFIVMFCMWAWAKPFLVSFYSLRGFLLQTWVVPRFGFQYFLRFATKGINEQIEKAILKADRSGVKVLSLAALNKNEALNGGGTLFVKKHPSLKVRVVHGNTLTAAVILHEIHEHVKEVFLTGATSKLGRAIALYLCQRHVRVLMLTLSTERFQKIKKEAPAECQKYLVQVTKYNAAKNCKTWIVGKWVTPREQSWAPAGTNFHQFVVPPIFHVRRDCTYHDLAAMKLPPDVHGLSVCEYTMERGVVHACHAGGLVHLLEGWTHHEVGAIDVAKIDIVWEAAMKHGFKPSSA